MAATLHPNHQFLLKVARGASHGESTRILDYGCGAAEVVSAGLAEGLEMYGTDAFYEGGDSRPAIPEGLLGTVVRELDGDRIPFPDGYFDVVLSNQVFEHVQDLGIVIAEIARVLKPSGVLVSLFPSRDVWREGHCGIPFLHRFRRGSRVRVTYAQTLRRLGLGYHTDGKGPERWTVDFLAWLDEFTFYRTRDEIRHAYDPFFTTRHDEPAYMAFRLEARGLPLAASASRAPLVSALSALACRKLAGLVMYSVRRPAS